MPQRNKKNQKAPQRQRRPRQPQKQKKPQQSRQRVTNPQAKNGMNTAAFAQMIRDPCNARLIPGLYGAAEGLIARTKTTFTTTVSTFPAPNTAGYVLWCPDFNIAKGGVPGCIFVYQTSLSNAAPANVPAGPYGAGSAQPAAINTAYHVADPAAALVASDVVADARCLSACMTMTFLGKMIDSSGEVCFLQNVPISELLSGGTGSTPATIDQLFNYSASKQRFGVETLETVYRLNLNSSDKFRDDTLFPLVLAGGITVTDPVSETFAPRVFGFAWRGTAPDAPISFDFIKNIEWRPEAISGFAQVPIVNSGRSFAGPALSFIDQMGPEAWSHVKGAAVRLGARMVRAAFTGNAANALEL